MTDKQIEQALKDRWISIKDRLPERDGMYLTYSNLAGRYVVWVFYYTEINGFGQIDVTHWMPLPEPPNTNGGT